MSAIPPYREAALCLLTTAIGLTRKSGSFLGQLVVDATPLSERQMTWLNQLLERAGLPPVDGEAVR